MKKFIIFALFFNIIFQLTAETTDSELQIKFIKGNITEKTSAVREASGLESVLLSGKAIDFALENHKILGDDRELDALAVAAVLSYTPEYIYNATDSEKSAITEKFSLLFSDFAHSSTVQIAVLSKITALRGILETSNFTELLNDYLNKTDFITDDSGNVKAVFSTLEKIGDNRSFVILYNLSNNPKYESYFPEIENAIVQLIPLSVDEMIQIINIGNITQINKVMTLCKKNNQISANIINEIAENVLNESIILSEGSSTESADMELLISLQIDSLKILKDNKCTRSAPTVLNFFNTARQEYADGFLTDEQFTEVISALTVIAPLTAVVPLTNYLEELNQLKEADVQISETVILSVIQSLGSIGDKTAFDSLLAVTYLNYSEAVLTAARGALAGLKW